MILGQKASVHYFQGKGGKAMRDIKRFNNYVSLVTAAVVLGVAFFLATWMVEGLYQETGWPKNPDVFQIPMLIASVVLLSGAWVLAIYLGPYPGYWETVRKDQSQPPGQRQGKE
jgi:hypothetical protein